MTNEQTTPLDDHQLLSDLIKALTTPPATLFTPQSNQYAVQATNAIKKLVNANSRRTKLVVQNLGGSPIEIGNDQVAFGQGFQIAANTTYFDDTSPYTGEWWCIANVVGPLDIRVRDESKAGS